MKSLKKILICLFIGLTTLSCQFESEGTGVNPINPEKELGALPTTDFGGGSSSLPPLVQSTLPAEFTLNMPPVQNQGGEGSCGGFSAGYAVMSYYINKFHNGNYDASNYFGSPEFLYNMGKEPGDCQSAGSIYSKLFAVLKSYGIATYATMPYSDQNGCYTQPNQQQLAEAANYKIQSWHYTSVSNTETVKRLLYSGYPVMIGIKAYDNLFSYSGGYYTKAGNYLGGHAVCIVGYNTNGYIIQNSWGSNWGINGYFYVTYYDLQQILQQDQCFVVRPAF